MKFEPVEKPRTVRTAAWILLGAVLCPLLSAQDVRPLKIKHIDVVMLSHLDVGFTDQPYLAVNELHRRYIDVALDAALATANKPPDQRFHWTEESILPVLAWWRIASPERRQQLIRAVEIGQVDAAAMPFNTLPMENAAEWKRMVPWAPDLWNAVHPKIAIQDDVNGMSRAGLTALADHGIRELAMGMNPTWGGPPFPAPKAFWWKLPDGRRVFVYLERSYGQADSLFMRGEWRVGDSPAASDMAFRPPRSGDILANDDASVRAAHDRCVKVLADLEKSGYVGDRLIAVFANQWRMDNEVPFIPMVEFIAAWNHLKLQPELRLVTMTEAMGTLEKEIGDRIPEYEGEWPDWWSNGPPAMPREVAASRFAKRYLEAANSPLFGTMSAAATATENDILADLALFEEHTGGGSAYGVTLPDSLETAGQLDEKGLLAFRSNSRAAWLFSQRARTQLYPGQAGLYAINATGAPMSGWVTVPVMTLRGQFHSVRDKVTGERIQLQFLPAMDPAGRPVPEVSPGSDWLPYINDFPRPMARFWVDHLDANSTRVFELDSTSQDNQPATPATFTAHFDEHGWPTSLQWPGMSQPLFQGAMGDFRSVHSKSPTPFQAFNALTITKDTNQRDTLRQRLFEEVPALAAGPVKIEETPYTIVYTQELTHPSLKWLIRRLEVWKQEPRARLDIRFDRLSSGDPEIYYIDFQLPSEKGVLPQLSEGGMPFVPFKDQIPGTCMDFFAIDGWAHYTTPEGDWLWVSRDAPVLSIGGTNVWTRLTAPPEHPNRLFSMVFNNTWFTNVENNSNGVMDFQYDLVWKKQIGADSGVLAESLVSDPVPLINPVAKENPFVMKDLFKP